MVSVQYAICGYFMHSTKPATAKPGHLQLYYTPITIPLLPTCMVLHLICWKQQAVTTYKLYCPVHLFPFISWTSLHYRNSLFYCKNIFAHEKRTKNIFTYIIIQCTRLVEIFSFHSLHTRVILPGNFFLNITTWKKWLTVQQ